MAALVLRCDCLVLGPTSKTEQLPHVWVGLCVSVSILVGFVAYVCMAKSKLPRRRVSFAMLRLCNQQRQQILTLQFISTSVEPPHSSTSDKANEQLHYKHCKTLHKQLFVTSTFSSTFTSPAHYHHHYLSSDFVLLPLLPYIFSVLIQVPLG